MPMEAKALFLSKSFNAKRRTVGNRETSRSDLKSQGNPATHKKYRRARGGKFSFYMKMLEN